MLRLNRCLCRGGPWSRIHRSAWMRIIPLSRLYLCAGCGCQVFSLRGLANNRLDPFTRT